MKPARFRRGTAGPGTPGELMRHGCGYDVFSAIFFGGRRRHVFTQLAALSGARPGDRELVTSSV